MSNVLHLPKLATHCTSGDSSNPEILILIDNFVIRYVTVLAAITYCFSCAKVVDLIELIPSLIDWHPTVSILLILIFFLYSSNNIMDRNSSQLHSDLESLFHMVESLGRHCFVSGHIATLSREELLEELLLSCWISLYL